MIDGVTRRLERARVKVSRATLVPLLVRFGIALSFVLALIVAASWVMRRLGYGAMMPARTGRPRRLGVVGFGVDEVAVRSRGGRGQRHVIWFGTKR